MEKKAGFFQDSKGNFSSTRLVFVCMVAYAMAAGWYTLTHEGSTACIAVVSAITGVAIGLKIGQNVQESKS